MSSYTDTFWSIEGLKHKPSQLERYVAKGSPDSIVRFIALGGGPKMGTTCESFARHRFSVLKKRAKGSTETGYDHLLHYEEGKEPMFVEQKSSGHWGEDDFKWQHVEPKHKWQILLLCGIRYEEIHFWAMNRTTFDRLLAEGKITNQGNKKGESSEGTWFSYSVVKDDLVEITSDDGLCAFVM